MSLYLQNRNYIIYIYIYICIYKSSPHRKVQSYVNTPGIEIKLGLKMISLFYIIKIAYYYLLCMHKAFHMHTHAPAYRRFYMSYPPHPEEKRYKFTTCSTFKPTQVHPKPLIVIIIIAAMYLRYHHHATVGSYTTRPALSACFTPQNNILHYSFACSTALQNDLRHYI